MSRAEIVRTPACQLAPEAVAYCPLAAGLTRHLGIWQAESAPSLLFRPE